MKNKKRHLFSLFLVFIMAIFTIATTRSPVEKISRRVSYRTTDGYLLINAITNKNPNVYDVNGLVVHLNFAKTDRKQVFVNHFTNDGIDLSETYIMGTYARIFQEDPLCEISINRNAFIIKINEELIKYDNEKIKNIELYINRRSSGTRYYYPMIEQMIEQSDESLFRIDGNGTIIAYDGYSFSMVVIPPQIDSIPVTAIGRNAFEDKSLINDIIIPDSVTSIGDSSFYHNHLTSVTIPSGVTSIGYNAFSENIIKSVIIPSDVIIGNGAFSQNRLTRIVIGENVTLAAGGRRNTPSFDNDFDNFYYENGRKAGTYILNNEQWSIR
jgi:hypothetical protein